MKKIHWKSDLVRTDFLMCGVIVFLFGYLCIDVPKVHNNIFFGLVLFPLFFCAKKRHFIDLHSSFLVNAFFVFLFYSVCTVFWSEFYSEALLWRYFKRMHVKPKPQPVALPPPYVHSFAEYRNPENNNFGVLRVMNDDLVRADVHTIDTIEM